MSLSVFASATTSASNTCKSGHIARANALEDNVRLYRVVERVHGLEVLRVARHLGVDVAVGDVGGESGGGQAEGDRTEDRDV